MAARHNTAAKAALRIQRMQAALELRRAGRDYREIGNQLGIGKSTAHRLVLAALAGAREQLEGDVQEAKAEEISRLDGLLTALWQKARAGEVGAVDRVLKIAERRAKLLGLDAPVTLAHTGKNGGPIVTRNDGIDLSTLTDEELAAYEALVASVARRANGGSGVGAPPA